MKSRIYIVFILLILIFVLLFSNYYILGNIEGNEEESMIYCPMDYRLDVDKTKCIPLFKSRNKTDYECPPDFTVSGNICIPNETLPICMSEKHEYNRIDKKCVLKTVIGNIVQPSKPHCDDGYHYSGPFKKCVADPILPINGNICPPNTVYKNNNCMRTNIRPFCKDGYTYKVGKCVKE